MGDAHLAMLMKTFVLVEQYAASVRRADLDADWETWVRVRAALELVAQCAIDGALDLISRRGLGTPQTYREAFTVLADAKIIDAELMQQLHAWAGLRNVLVHMYTKLGMDRVHAALRNTAPLRAFHAILAKAIAARP